MLWPATRPIPPLEKDGGEASATEIAVVTSTAQTYPERLELPKREMEEKHGIDDSL